VPRRQTIEASAPRLPDAELEVLASLKRLGHGTAAEIRTALERLRPMTHGSTMTLLGRLEEKGLVSRRKADTGKAYIYRTTARAATTLKQQPRKLLKRVFGGDLVLFVSSLLESAPPDDAELDELQSMLDEMRRDRRGPRGKRS